MDGWDGLNMGPKMNYRSAEVVGDPNQILNCRIWPSNQASLGLYRIHNPQIKDCRPNGLDPPEPVQNQSQLSWDRPQKGFSVLATKSWQIVGPQVSYMGPTEKQNLLRQIIRDIHFPRKIKKKNLHPPKF